MIIAIDNKCERTNSVAPTIATIITQFKGFVSKTVGQKFWHKSYYDHIIRNEKSYAKIWDYIDTNPYNWHKDEYNNGTH